jgi:hypothetical protein
LPKSGPPPCVPLYFCEWVKVCLLSIYRTSPH